MSYRNFIVAICVLGFLSLVSLTQARDLATFLWHPGATNTEFSDAKLIGIGAGFRTEDLAKMRADQMIETSSGHQISVGRLRGIQQMIALAQSRNTAHAPLNILPAPSGACATLPPGETLSQIAARPANDVICLPSGRRVSVEQIRSLEPLVRGSQELKRAQVPPSSEAPLTISTREQLVAELQHAPDSKVLISDSGHAATVGQVRATIAAAQLRTRIPKGVPQ